MINNIKLIREIVKAVDMRVIKEIGKMPVKFWLGASFFSTMWQLPEIITAIGELLK